MYGVLGEDTTDAETIKAIVARLVAPRVKIHAKGFGSKDKLLDKGSSEITLFRGLGYSKFIVCHDSDGAAPSLNHRKVMERVVGPSGVSDDCCVLIPVYMIESWILANIEAVTGIFTSWKPNPIANPEKIPDPKGELERLSRAENRKPRYSPPTHNPQVAKHLDLKIVAKKCPSFRPLLDFLRQP